MYIYAIYVGSTYIYHLLVSVMAYVVLAYAMAYIDSVTPSYLKFVTHSCLMCDFFMIVSS